MVNHVVVLMTGFFLLLFYLYILRPHGGSWVHTLHSWISIVTLRIVRARIFRNRERLDLAGLVGLEFSCAAEVLNGDEVLSEGTTNLPT